MSDAQSPPSDSDAQSDGHFSEFLQFLTADARPDLRNTALHYLEGLSPTADGIQMFVENDFKLADALLTLCSTVPYTTFPVLRSLINVSAGSPQFCSYLAANEALMKLVLTANMKDKGLELCSQLLSNITINSESAESVWKQIAIHHPGFISDTTKRLNSAENIDAADYLGYVLRNLSQVKDFRRSLVCDDESKQFFALLPLVKQGENLKRKGLTVDIVRNCCFDDDLHQMLTTSEELFVCLFMPLIGAEELEEAENDALPLDLQYMDSSKTREGDEHLRCSLLEAIYQLCATSIGRTYLRQKGAYGVLRHFHQWEKEDGCERLCGNIIGMLILSEEEIGLDSIRAAADNDATEN